MADEKWTVFVQPTTGGRVELCVPPSSTVDTLKLELAKRFKVPKDKIVLLHRNKQLTEGSLQKNNIVDGSKLTLLPNVEAGQVNQNPEQCVMQALEMLNEFQVDNFLAGRSPLNLTMRLGDHMMFIQLQLSTALPTTGNSSSGESTTTSLPTPPTTPTSTPPLPFSSSSSSQSSNVPQSMPSPPPSPKPAPEKPEHNIFTEASRNLMHTLRQMSTSALTKKMNENCTGRCTARKQGGATIESMYHHGRGVFSGTFSGTLSPLLQDGEGRPRRNICTIIHILNDLLGASSHCNPLVQCQCSASSTSNPSSQKTEVPKEQESNDDKQKQDEEKLLRQKVHHIQSMLKERRQKRSRRRAPYSTETRPPIATRKPRNFESNGVFVSANANLRNSECPEQKNLMDYSSETAVA